MTQSPQLPRPRIVFAKYHAHVYFDEKTTEQARELCQSASWLAAPSKLSLSVLGAASKAW